MMLGINSWTSFGNCYYRKKMPKVAIVKDPVSLDK